MGTEAAAALAFLVPVLPVALWVAWSDLARMKIPNLAILALVAIFAAVGPFVLPLGDWGVRWLHLALLLVIGIGLNAAGAMGAGDAKFIAAAAPFVAAKDTVLVLLILSACAVLGFILHRIAMHGPVRRAVPDWQSWHTGRRFPFGFPLAAALVLYLALAAFTGSWADPTSAILTFHR